MIDLSNQTVLIIGGMDALTAGIARQLHHAGAEVVFAYAPDDSRKAADIMNAIEGQPRGEAVNLDDPDVLGNQIAAFGDFRAVVVTPSYVAFRDFMDSTPEDWDKALNRNFGRTTYAAQAAAKQMVAAGQGGRIIFISMAAALMPFAGSSAAGTSLAAVHALAKMAAVDLGEHGITVNVLAVGWVETESTASMLKNPDFIQTDIPLRRTASPEDIGNVCCFLVSELSSYITGAVIPVDGGYILTRSEGKSPYSKEQS